MSTFTQNDGSDQIDDFRTTKKFICRLCSFEFNQEEHLKNHVKHCQDIENPADRLGAHMVSVKYEDCSKELEQYPELDEPVTTIETLDIKVEDMSFTEYTVSGFNCNLSDPPMEQLEELCEQTDRGHDNKQATDTCNVGDFVTTKSRHLKAHIRRHGGKKQLKSNAWDVSNRKLVSRKRRKKMYTENKPFKCTICGYATVRNAHLTSHLRTHSGEKPFKCTICNFASASSANLTKHMRIHTKEKPFKCTICDYATTRSTSLAIHMSRHTRGKPFKCTVCNSTCASSANLTSHMRIHTVEKPFKCTLCDYACTRSSSLTLHMRTHTGHKPFKCTICDYASTNQSDVTRHTRTHTGEKPFKCTFCDHACARRATLRRHMKTHQKETS